MHSSSAITKTLLDIELAQRRTISPRTNLFSFILAFLNLLLCGLSESVLRSDTGGHYLSLFLFVHSSAYFLLALALFMGGSKDILMKVKMFPTSSMSRLLFVLLSNIRHPFSIALLASNAFFFAILYRQSLSGVVASIAFYLLLMAGISVTASVVFLYCEKKNLSAAAALTVAAAFAFAGFVASAVMSAQSMVMVVPPIRWCAEGIISAVNTKYSFAFTRCLLLMLLPASMMIAGRRVV